MTALYIIGGFIGWVGLGALVLHKFHQRVYKDSDCRVDWTPDSWKGFLEARDRHPAEVAHVEFKGPEHPYRAEHVFERRAA